MSIPDAKMKALTELVGEQRAASIAAIAEQANKELVDAGIEHKETAPAVDMSAVLDGIKGLTESVKSLSDGLDGRISTAVKSVTDPLTTQVASTQEGLTRVEKSIADLSTRVAAVELSDDAKMAALITPRAAAAQGAYRATKAADNLPTGAAAAAAAAAAKEEDGIDKALAWLPAGAR